MRGGGAAVLATLGFHGRFVSANAAAFVANCQDAGLARVSLGG